MNAAFALVSSPGRLRPLAGRTARGFLVLAAIHVALATSSALAQGAQPGFDPAQALELMKLARQEEYSRKRAECRQLRKATDLAGLERARACLDQLIRMGDDPLLQPNTLQAQDEDDAKEIDTLIAKLQADRDRAGKREALFKQLVDLANQQRIAGNFRAAHAAMTDALKVNPNPTDPDILRVRDLVMQDYRRWVTVQAALFTALGLGSAGGIYALYRLLKSKPKTLVLEMIEGPQPGEVYALERDTVVVGASPTDADVVVVDMGRRISRKHCEINRRARRYYLVDTSTNGTRINGKDIPQGTPVKLKRGDLIGLADDIVLKFG